MRVLVDIVIVVMLLVALVTILIYQRAEQHKEDRIDAVRQAMRAIESESLYRAAVGEVEATPRGYARVVDSAWFEHQPRNIFIDDEALGWVEHVSNDRETHHVNPLQIVVDDRNPQFWYNPYRGVIRARVPMQFSQRSTVELYNTINHTRLRVEDVAWPRHRSASAEVDPAAPVAVLDAPAGDGPRRAGGGTGSAPTSRPQLPTPPLRRPVTATP